jgi:hypothetical protein
MKYKFAPLHSGWKANQNSMKIGVSYFLTAAGPGSTEEPIKICPVDVPER